MNKKLHLKIDGMHCNSCVALIQEELKSLDGITEINIDLQKGIGSMVLNIESVSSAQVIEAIKLAGYKAEVTNQSDHTSGELNMTTKQKTIASDKSLKAKPQSKMQAEGIVANKKQILSLSGMHCASCAGIIERSLKKVPGVKQANVNFAAEKASIIFDENLSSIEDLIQAVKKPATKPL